MLPVIFLGGPKAVSRLIPPAPDDAAPATLRFPSPIFRPSTPPSRRRFHFRERSAV